MNNLPKDFDDDHIARNRKACGTPIIKRRGGGDGGNGGRGRGGSGGRGGVGGRGHGGGGGGSRNYEQGHFISPANNKMVRVVNGKA